MFLRLRVAIPLRSPLLEDDVRMRVSALAEREIFRTRGCGGLGRAEHSVIIASLVLFSAVT